MKENAKESEEKMQKLYLEFQMLEQQIKHLEKQSNTLKNHLLELISTTQSLEEIKNVEEKTEILVPISTGIYAKAELKDKNSFIVNVGANIAATKDLESTKKIISEQIKEISEVHENVAQELQRHLEKAASMEEEINKIASELQAQ